MKKLTKKEFKAWLESKAEKTKVAPKGYNSGSCPISNYYKSLGFEDVATTPTYSALDTRIVKHNKWVDKFVTNLDKQTGYHDGETTSVSAKKALEVLNRKNDKVKI